MARCFTAYRQFGWFGGIIAYPPNWSQPNASVFNPEPLPFPHVMIGERTDLGRSLDQWKIVTFVRDAEPKIEVPTRVDNLTYFVKEEGIGWRVHKKPKLRMDRSRNEGHMALVHLIGFDEFTGRKYRRRKCYLAGCCRSGMCVMPNEELTCSECGLKYVHPEPHPDEGEVIDWRETYYSNSPWGGAELLATGHGRYGQEHLVRLEVGAMMRCQHGYGNEAIGWLLAWDGRPLCFRQSEAWIDTT